MFKQTMGSSRMKSKVHIAVMVLYGAPIATSVKQTSSFCSFLPNTVINIRPLLLHNNLRNQVVFADICRLRVPVYFQVLRATSCSSVHAGHIQTGVKFY